MRKLKLISLIMVLGLLVSCTQSVNTINNATNENTEKHLAENYPRIDGSTANMPMMAEIRSEFLGEDLTTAENNTKVTTTDYAWRNLVDGKADLLLVYEPSAETKKIIEDSNVKLKITPIGRDALVFIVNDKNPVKNLTTENLKDIYSGKITNWKELGGEDVKIEAYQREFNSGSQTLFLKLVMNDTAPMDPPEKYKIFGMEGLIKEIASYNDAGNAIGFSVYYYAKKMYAVPGLRLINVDNVEPNDNTIASGEYPYLNEYYLVIREDTPEDSETMKLYNFINSKQGTEAIKKAGYIPIN